MEAVLVVDGELDPRDRGVRLGTVGRRARLGVPQVQQRRLDVPGLARVGRDLVQRGSCSSQRDGGDEAFDQGRIGEHDAALAGIVASQLERQLGAEHGAPEIHDHEHAVRRRDPIDGLLDSRCVGAEHVVVETGCDLDRWRRAADHLEGELDGGLRQADDCARRRRCRPRRTPTTGGRTRSPPPRRATPRTSLRDPGGRRCAHRDSWPDPCGRPSGSWRHVPRRPLATPPRRRRWPSVRSAAAASSASSAGWRLSYMVLSPSSGRPRATSPSTPARNALARSSTEIASRRPAGRAQPEEERAVQGPAGAADVAHQGHADGLEELVRCAEAGAVELLAHGTHAAVHVDAVIGIPDGGVEIRQVRTLFGDEVTEAADPRVEAFCPDPLGPPEEKADPQAGRHDQHAERTENPSRHAGRTYRSQGASSLEDVAAQSYCGDEVRGHHVRRGPGRLSLVAGVFGCVLIAGLFRRSACQRPP